MAIELDKRLFPVLEETLADCSNVELVEGDVLKLDLNRLIEERLGGEQVCVCANLPYYITSCNYGIAGRRPSHKQHHGYGAEGGGQANLCQAWNPGMRGGERFGTLPL